MPTVIKTSGGGSGPSGKKPETSGQPGKKPAKSGDGIKFSGNINELPKPLLIGLGVLVLLFLGFMVNQFVVPLRPPAKDADKVAPPPGYPDIPPFNSKAWQDGGKKVTPGIPPPEALQRMNGGAKPSAGGR